MTALGGAAYVAAKQVPAAAGIVLANFSVGGMDMEIAGAILVGLIAGAVLRPSRYIGKPNSMRSMTRDFLGSGMALLANFIISAVMVALGTLVVPGFPAIAAAGVGLFMGYKGPDGINYFNEKYMGAKPGEPHLLVPREPEAPNDMRDQLDRVKGKTPDPKG